MSKKHNLTEAFPEISIDNTNIKRTSIHKNLGIHFDQHLTFNTHHKETLKSAYATLISLNSLKHTLSTKIKLQLIDSLIFNKITYGNIITHPTNHIWTHKYNKFFKTALSFAYNKYISNSDLPNIAILNFQSCWKLSLLSLAFKSLYSPTFPSYLKLSVYSNQYHFLRSSSAPLISQPNTKDNTFADLAATHFNSLPGEIRNIQGEDSFPMFKNKVKHLLLANQQA